MNPPCEVPHFRHHVRDLRVAVLPLDLEDGPDQRLLDAAHLLEDLVVVVLPVDGVDRTLQLHQTLHLQ